MIRIPAPGAHNKFILEFSADPHLDSFRVLCDDLDITELFVTEFLEECMIEIQCYRSKHLRQLSDDKAYDDYVCRKQDEGA